VSHYQQTIDYGFDYFAHDTFHDDAGPAAAAEYLRKRNGAKPLCLFVGSNWPHVPWPSDSTGTEPKSLTLPAGSIDTPATREWRARYAAAVARADDDLGVVLAAARAVLGENTLIVMSGDHGAQWPFAKWNCYEAGVCVPLIVSWPGTVKAGTRTSAMVSWIDLLPTLIEAVGGKSPDDIDGRSFLQVLRGERETHRDRIFTTHSGDGTWNVYPIRAVRDGDWKYIRNLHPEFAFTTHIDLPGNLGQRSYFKTWEAAATKNPEAAAIVKRYHERPAEELYDLKSDPAEEQNLAGDPAQSEKLNQLRKTMDQWLQQQGDRLQVYAQPRLMKNPKSFGPDAAPGTDVAPAR